MRKSVLPRVCRRPVGIPQAGFICHGRALLRENERLKLCLAVSFAVIAALVWRGQW